MCFVLALFLSVFLSCSALAHTGDGAVGSFSQGILHSFTGIDHVLAIAAVGLLACRLKGSAYWLMPASFTTAMVAGGILGMFLLPFPELEVTIALSLVVLGGLLVYEKRLSLPTVACVIAVFAFFHGFAHGNEIPRLAAKLPYGVGLTMATTTAQVAAIAFGLGLRRQGNAYMARFVSRTGIVIAAAGILVAFTPV